MNSLNKLTNKFTNNIYNLFIEEREELLKSISENYNLSFNILYKKYITEYIKKNESHLLIEIDNLSEEENDIKNNFNRKILEKKVINNIVCYLENTDGGYIYNKELEKLGEINNGKYIFY